MNIIKNIYFDTSHPAGFGSYTNLRKYVPSHISDQQIKKFLSSQDCYTLHAPAQRKFERAKVFATNIDQCWHIDIAFMDKLKRENENYAYLLVAVDVLSKFAFVRPMHKKTAKDATEAFSDILEKSERKPETIYVDMGGEWTGKIFKTFAEDKGIKIFYAKNTETKACCAERLIRTLKMRLYRYFTHVGHHKYIDVLQDVVSSYNKSIHASIGMEPAKVSEENMLNVWKKLYKNEFPMRSGQPKYSLGNSVRCSKLKRNFAKGYHHNYTEEIFKICKVYRTNPVMYELKDFKDNVIQGRFYEKELIKVIPPKLYKIDKILRKRGKGVTQEVLVKWTGYPDIFNQWIKVGDLKKYK